MFGICVFLLPWEVCERILYTCGLRACTQLVIDQFTYVAFQPTLMAADARHGSDQG